MIDIQPRSGLRLKLVVTGAVLALGASAHFLTGGRGAAAQASDPAPATTERAARAAGSAVRLAQAATPSLAIDTNFRIEPGQSAKLPVRVNERQALDPLSHVIVRGIGDDLSLSKGETIGNGVWLISVWELLDVELRAKPNARGPKDVVLTLVGPNGKPLSETKASLQIAAGGAELPKVAPLAPKGTPVAASQAKGGSALAAPAPAATAATAGSAKSAPLPPAQAPTVKTAQAGRPAAPASPAAKQMDEQQLVSYARHLVRECTTCHSLYGHDQGIPLMIGLSKDRFLDTMRLYKDGKRDNGAMVSVAQTLTDEQTLALALYLGRIKPPSQPVAATAPQAEAATSGPPIQIKAAAGGGSDRAERWVARGRQMFDTGDVAQARLMFEKAAEVGHPRAAFLLGTTFDPNVLPWRPAMGLEAQPAKAKQWYLFAKQLGVGAEVDQRLAELP